MTIEERNLLRVLKKRLKRTRKKLRKLHAQVQITEEHQNTEKKKK